MIGDACLGQPWGASERPEDLGLRVQPQDEPLEEIEPDSDSSRRSGMKERLNLVEGAALGFAFRLPSVPARLDLMRVMAARP